MSALPAKMSTVALSAWFGAHQVLRAVSLLIYERRITALIGPSGSGKATLLRCLNRMHELRPQARVAGRVLFDQHDIYGRGVDAVQVRRHVGMVFRKPNPFPALSIRDNVLAGLRLQGLARGGADRRAEAALRQAALWDEVKDRLAHSGASLSLGQQQRLCIARALALRPEVLLLHEPCSALDPIATAHTEALLQELRQHLTVVIVTHNLQQAARVADYTALLIHGELVEHDSTDVLFTRPSDARTEDYLTGRFG